MAQAGEVLNAVRVGSSKNERSVHSSGATAVAERRMSRESWREGWCDQRIGLIRISIAVSESSLLSQSVGVYVV